MLLTNRSSRFHLQFYKINLKEEEVEMTDSKNKKCGHLPLFYRSFTLIELLAILAGMLLPALNMVKEKARAINCMANYSSVAKAIAMYVGDNKDTLPPYYAANTNPWVTGEPLKIFIFGQGDNGMLTPYIGSISKITSAQPFGSIKQDGNRETLSCPSKAPRKEKVVNSYAVNNQLKKADNAKNGKLKLSRIRHPSQLMHIGEPDPQETSGGLSPWNVEYPGSKPGFPHSNSMNISFADCHVERRHYLKVPKETNYKADNFWYNE